MKFGTNCKEVHRLSSEGMDRSLTLGERARMRLHLLGCTACRNFNGQMRLLREAMHKLAPGAASDEEERK
jgi:Putative zinc-finger